jgi:hypothetical protein
MGRDLRNEHWTKIIQQTTQTDASRALSRTAQSLYPWIKFESHGANRNNGLQILAGHIWPHLTKENAANLAGFNGAKDVVEGVLIFEENNTVPRIIATHFGIEVAA